MKMYFAHFIHDIFTLKCDESKTCKFTDQKKNVKNLEHRMYVGVLVLMLHLQLKIATIVYVELGFVTGQHFANHPKC